jgi:hypothetical protein
MPAFWRHQLGAHEKKVRKDAGVLAAAPKNPTILPLLEPLRNLNPRHELCRDSAGLASRRVSR